MTGTRRLVLTRAGEIGRDVLEAVEAITGPCPSHRLGKMAVSLETEMTDSRLDELRVRLAPFATDANLAPLTPPAIGLFLADMDSTIISVECIDELADYASVKPQVAAITERAMRGELDFEGALDERVALLEGLGEEDLAACYRERVKLNPGARTLVRTLRARGALTALVSGGFTYFSERVAEAAGFEMTRANRLLFDGDRLSGKVARPILGRAAKRETLEELQRQRGLDASAILAVGDGANDLDMIGAAGIGVAYHAKPALAEAAGIRLDHSDLSAILSICGIPEKEWIV